MRDNADIFTMNVFTTILMGDVFTTILRATPKILDATGEDKAKMLRDTMDRVYGAARDRCSLEIGEDVGFDDAELHTVGYLVSTLRDSGLENEARKMERDFGEFERYDVTIEARDTYACSEDEAIRTLSTSVWVPVSSTENEKRPYQGFSVELMPRDADSETIDRWVTSAAKEVLFWYSMDGMVEESATVKKDGVIVSYYGPYKDEITGE